MALLTESDYYSTNVWRYNEDIDIILFLGGMYEERGERRVAREVYRDGMRHHPSDARVFAAFERVGGYRR